MPYINDVFISYKRELNWTPWTRDHFARELASYLADDLRRPPKIFIDQRLEENFGQDWVSQLAENLAQSRVCIIVFSGGYFSSDWCLHELDLMIARARQAGGRFSDVIIPVIGHDGDMIPDVVARLTPLDLKDYRIAHMYRETALYMDFSRRLGGLSPAVARAIEAAPPFEDTWVTTCIARFNAVYEAQRRGDRVSPSEFILKPLAMPTTNPRLIM
jgi:hypothetical protein